MGWSNSPFQPPSSPSALVTSSDSGPPTTPTCLLIQGDKLYMGTTTGALFVYSYDPSDPGNESEGWELVEVKKGLCKGRIEDLGFVRDVNSLVVLADSTITLFPLPSFSPASSLAGVRGALSFSLHSSVEHVVADVPTLVTRLLVGCRRRIVLYEWKDGELSNPKDLTLPHTPRTVVFLNTSNACLGYTTETYALLNISQSLKASEVPLIPQASTNIPGAALTGYLIPTLGKEPKPLVVAVGDGEAVVCRENEGLLISQQDDSERCKRIAQWQSTPPVHLAYIHPYLLSIVSPHTVEIRSRLSPSARAEQWEVIANVAMPSATVPWNLKHLLHVPPQRGVGHSPGFLAISTGEETKLCKVEMRPWKAQIEALVFEGRYEDALLLLGSLDSKSANLGETPETLVSHLKALQALHAFVRPSNVSSHSMSSVLEQCLQTFVYLNINPFMVISLFPEEVSSRLASIYHHSERGSGSEEQKEELWREMLFGPPPSHLVRPPSEEKQDHDDPNKGPQQAQAGTTSSRIRQLGSFLSAAASPSGLYLGDDKGKEKDDDSASVSSQRSVARGKKHKGDLLNALMTYLSTLRPRIGALLREMNKEGERKSGEPTIMNYTELPIQQLIPLPLNGEARESPNFSVYVPISSMETYSRTSLTLLSQLIDTTLVHVYLTLPSRLSLLSSLSRLKDSHVVIEDVEGRMRELGRWADLREMWRNKGGKIGHGKALEVVKEEFAGKVEAGEMIRIVVAYVGKLDEDDWEVVEENARWVWNALQEQRVTADGEEVGDEDWGAEEVLKIFTSDMRSAPLSPPRVCDFFLSLCTSPPASPHRTGTFSMQHAHPSSQPKHPVAINLCISYLEYLFREYGFRFRDTSIGETLLEFYLDGILGSRSPKRKEDLYAKLLRFLDEEEYFDVSRVYGMLLSAVRRDDHEDLPEARAILLGKMGKHEHALEVYVYRMKEFRKALQYCMKLYHPSNPPDANKGIFMKLLNIYLSPSPTNGQGMEQELLDAAIQLLSTQPSASCLPIDQVSPLLPPFLKLSQLGSASSPSQARGYLPTSLTTLTSMRNQTKLTRSISQSFLNAVSTQLVTLESRRVKVDDARVCPACLKLLAGGRGGGGGGVLSVHFPRGEVTHYQCRERFKSGGI